DPCGVREGATCGRVKLKTQGHGAQYWDSTMNRKEIAMGGMLRWGLMLIVAAGAWAEPLVFYVAPDGNDGWSGTKAAVNAAGTDGPWGSLAGARNRLRALRGEGKLTG